MDSAHDHSHSSHDDHDHPIDLAKSIRTYLKVGITLIAFTFITVFVAYKVDLGDKHLNIALGLIIAAFKVSLVGLIFMHLKHERGLIYKTLLFAFIFFAGMMFLFCLAYMDPIANSFLKP
ncbi:MAG TPA: cytochrome C oxidase subunit IV family protein [Verrucomicrobiales bacterium]|jgi:caa(3)-type oxidase subunit IV|nr:cytochrome C oxidase subunit IV family protein [Verrucomicrobiales bacterium]